MSDINNKENLVQGIQKLYTTYTFSVNLHCSKI